MSWNYVSRLGKCKFCVNSFNHSNNENGDPCYQCIEYNKDKSYSNFSCRESMYDSCDLWLKRCGLAD